jgi:hypothetical protein
MFQSSQMQQRGQQQHVLPQSYPADSFSHETGTFVDGTLQSPRSSTTTALLCSCDYSLDNGGSWTAATVSGSGATTQCQSTTATCTTSQSLTILMRATNTGGTTNTGPLTRTCDASAPTSTIASPADSATISLDEGAPRTYTISGTGLDVGSSVAKVEVSVNREAADAICGPTGAQLTIKQMVLHDQSRAADAVGTVARDICHCDS